MGGTKKLSKFIVDWENGTRVECNNGAIEREMLCINLHSCISVTDRVQITELHEHINSDRTPARTY